MYTNAKKRREHAHPIKGRGGEKRGRKDKRVRKKKGVRILGLGKRRRSITAKTLEKGSGISRGGGKKEFR